MTNGCRAHNLGAGGQAFRWRFESTHSLYAVLVALSLLADGGTARAQTTFTPLGFFGGTHSEAWDVSAAGSVVVGTVTDVIESTSEVFLWTRASSVLRPAIVQDRAAVSANGLVVVGSSPDVQAFRWAPLTGMFEGLGDLPGGAFGSAAYGTSTDGQVVVGYSQSADGNEAFRWTSSSGMVSLGDLPGGSLDSVARGVSADGSVVVGRAIGAARSQAFRWTENMRIVGLGVLAGADGSDARAVSADGSVVVGMNQFVSTPARPRPFTTYEAYRWTAAEGMVGLGDLAGGRDSSEAYDVSADGSVIVGIGETSFDGSIGTPEAFYWTARAGMLNLREVLIAGGATGLDGWRLAGAHGVSYDGLTIVGTGIDPSGRTQAFVATIPEPSALAFTSSCAAAALGFYLLARRRNRTVN